MAKRASPAACGRCGLSEWFAHSSLACLGVCGFALTRAPEGRSGAVLVSFVMKGLCVVNRWGVLVVGGLTAVLAMLVVSGCSGEQRSAAGPSSDVASSGAGASSAVSSSASASVSESPVSAVGVPDAPVPVQSRTSGQRKAEHFELSHR